MAFILPYEGATRIAVTAPVAWKIFYPLLEQTKEEVANLSENAFDYAQETTSMKLRKALLTES